MTVATVQMQQQPAARKGSIFRRLLLRFKEQEVRFVLLTLLITVVVSALSAQFQLTWRSGFALALGMFSLLLWYGISRNDTFLKRLLVMGVAAGFTELLADCWLVQKTGTLVYPGNEPALACSPFYMPFAWAVVIIQIGYLGWLVSREEKLWVSMIATTLIGMAVIPLYEHWAKSAGWWFYQNCRMVGNTPWYIILAEGMMCAFLPLLFRYIHQKGFRYQLLLGIVQGLWIWASYYVSFLLIE